MGKVTLYLLTTLVPLLLVAGAEVRMVGAGDVVVVVVRVVDEAEAEVTRNLPVHSQLHRHGQVLM